MTIFQTWFEHRIKEAGYEVTHRTSRNNQPDVQLEYSLGYCQGDYVGWRGSVIDHPALAKRVLSKEDLARLSAHKLLNNVELAELPWPDFVIDTQHRGDGIDCGGELNERPEHWDAEDEAVMDRYLAAVKEDVRDLNVDLRHEGYKINEATDPMWLADGEEVDESGRRRGTIVRQYSRPTVVVQVILWEEDDCEWLDLDDIKQLIDGTMVVYGLEVLVYERDPEDDDLGDLLARSTIAGVTDDRKLSSRREVAKEQLSEALDELRAQAAEQAA